MTENELPAPSLRRRILSALPWLTVVNEFVFLACFGVIWVVNDLRVALSYRPENPARNAIYARYEMYGEVSGAILRGSAVCLIVVLLTQFIAWSWIREATASSRHLRWILPLTAVLGLLELAFMGFLYCIAVSASMVG